jgi:hypothetical protein
MYVLYYLKEGKKIYIAQLNYILKTTTFKYEALTFRFKLVNPILNYSNERLISVDGSIVTVGKLIYEKIRCYSVYKLWITIVRKICNFLK